MLRSVFACSFLLCAACSQKVCEESPTTASGTFAPKKICSGDLIFEDDFDKFDLKKWQHENTLAGGGVSTIIALMDVAYEFQLQNWEFQWYTNNRSNSFVDNGTLFIKPSLTADTFGEKFLTSGTLDINGGSPAD